MKPNKSNAFWFEGNELHIDNAQMTTENAIDSLRGLQAAKVVLKNENVTVLDVDLRQYLQEVLFPIRRELNTFGDSTIEDIVNSLNGKTPVLHRDPRVPRNEVWFSEDSNPNIFVASNIFDSFKALLDAAIGSKCA